MPIENPTVEDLQHELQVMISESMADLGDDAPSEGDVAHDLFGSLTYSSDYPAELLAEVARREFGYVPMGSRPDVVDAYSDEEREW